MFKISILEGRFIMVDNKLSKIFFFQRSWGNQWGELGRKIVRKKVSDLADDIIVANQCEIKMVACSHVKCSIFNVLFFNPTF